MKPGLLLGVVLLVVFSPMVTAQDHGAHAPPASAHGPSDATLCLICPAAREGANTAWQPDTSGGHGLGVRVGAWTLRTHLQLAVAYTSEAGPRGGDATYVPGFLMFTARRPAGRGVVGIETMWTPEPAMGAEGYPLLTQTGETADGVTALVDRQHPHDLPMELAATYAMRFASDRSAFVYAAAVGAPALGPPAFMHRRSGRRLPTAPISHHWFDASHVSFGVVTAGIAVSPRVQMEASAFRGREPDQHRWGFERPALDSFSARLSVNPTPTIAVQTSLGVLHDAEQLHPGANVSRITTTAMFAPRWRHLELDVTAGWARNSRATNFGPSSGYLVHGDVSQAWLAEGTLQVRTRHAFMTRLEHVTKDELFGITDPRHGQAFPVGRVALGYAIDLLRTGPVRVGLGAAAAWTWVGSDLEAEYGGPPRSGVVFVDIRTH